MTRATAGNEIDYETYTVARLDDELDRQGIKYTSKDLKADKIALLEGRE